MSLAVRARCRMSCCILMACKARLLIRADRASSGLKKQWPTADASTKCISKKGRRHYNATTMRWRRVVRQRRARAAARLNQQQRRVLRKAVK